jgi:restriction system protein
MTVEIPAYHELMWPLVEFMRKKKKPVTIAEIEAEFKRKGFPDRPSINGKSKGSELAYRLAWARTYLKKGGLVEDSSRGIWGLTDQGLMESKERILQIHKIVAKESREKSKNAEPTNDSAQRQEPEMKDGIKSSFIAEVRQILWLLDSKLMTEENAVKAIATISSKPDIIH